MADDGEVYIYPGEQNLHVDNLKCCTCEKLDESDCKGNVMVVKLIWMICHKFNGFDAVIEYVADVEMHCEGYDEFGQKQVKLVDTFNHFKVVISLELDKNTPNKASLQNENKDASVEESCLSLLGDLESPSVWLVHAEQGESDEVLAEHHFIFLFCHQVEYLLLDTAFKLNVQGLIGVVRNISLLIFYRVAQFVLISLRCFLRSER